MNNLAIATQTIKDTVSALDVGRAIGLEIRHGRVQCPIHGGQNYNCVLYPGNRGFFCHQCHAGGDVISFAQQYYKISYKDCIAWFDSTFHMGLDLGTHISPQKQRQAEIALQRRKRAIEFEEWKKRMRFDLTLTADEIVRRLEKQREEHMPKTPDEPWSEAFCEAVTVLPEARAFADDCWMECMEVRKD